jgi:hypothetical protein
MATESPTQVSERASDTRDACLAIPDKFGGFVANPAALKRGGAAVQAVRNQKCRGLLRWMAEAEVNRFWRHELAAREGK